MIRGPRHKDILPEHEQIVNAGFHVIANGCGFINGLTILLAMPSRLIELLFVGAELQRTQSTYLFVAYAPSAEPGCPRAARLQHRGHAAPSRRNRNESHPRRTRCSHSRSSWMARRQRPQGSQKHLAPAAAAACAGAQPARKYLAIHAGELAVEPHLQILRRNRRSLLLRLEYAHRSTMENHVHRSPRLDSRRSLIVRVGINYFCSRSASRVQWLG